MRTQFSYYTFNRETDEESARKIDGFVQEVATLDSEMTDEEFKSAVESLLPRLKPFLDWKSRDGYKLNPFTITRHLLYWHNKSAFHDMLFEGQRKAFDKWLESQGKDKPLVAEDSK
jgi:hypothetical protein